MATKYLRVLSKPTNVEKLRLLTCADEVELDIITKEFKSSSNRLSFWRFENEIEMQDAIKAIIFSGISLEKFRFFIIDDAFIHRIGASILNTEGKTAYINGRNLHVDIEVKDYKHLGIMLNDLISHLKINDSTFKVARDEVNQIVKNAFCSYQIDANEIIGSKGLKLSLVSLLNENFFADSDNFYNDLFAKIKEI